MYSPSTPLDPCPYELKQPIAALENPNEVSQGLVPTVSCWKFRLGPPAAPPCTCCLLLYWL